MKRAPFWTQTAALVLLCAAAAVARAADLYVISNPGTTVEAGELRDIFLGEKQFAGAVKLVPVDNASAQEAFLSKVMKMEASKYTAAWTKKTFRDGANPPPIKGSDTETLEFVKRTAGAVSYVGSAPSGVNIVAKF
ncbi:MAG TPA: hypothetical protein VH183_02660 [Burkholderiaceae bacterium]|jgi:hypothetical protein|nr:hypothetical protein [Burkholderiaceae bacterium]